MQIRLPPPKPAQPAEESAEEGDPPQQPQPVVSQFRVSMTPRTFAVVISLKKVQERREMHSML